MQLYKRTTIYFDGQDEDLLQAFVCDKFNKQDDVENLRELCTNILYAIQNDSKSLISDVRPIVLKKGESHG